MAMGYSHTPLHPSMPSYIPLLFSATFLSVAAWDNGAALTPPMGFASWNVFGCNYTDAVFREMADAFVAKGLSAKGYEFMLVQECIVPKGARDPVTHVVQPNTEMFPHGLADLADYFHSKGLKAGIYTDIKSLTCADYEGSGPGPGIPSHWELDALTYAQWGFDMIEADFCNPSGDNETAYELYKSARDAIAAATAATGRIITFYACNWGAESPWLWAPEVANLFRNTGDICAPGSIRWQNILHNFDNTIVHSSTPPARPGLPGTGIGAWNDPDMLGVGMVGINDIEGRSQFSLWCILGAPLFLGTDVRTASDVTMATIGNAEAIAIDQDPLGIQGYVVDTSGGADVPTAFENGFLYNLGSCPPPPQANAWTFTADGRLAQGGGSSGSDETMVATVFACNTAPGTTVFSYVNTTNECHNQIWSWNGPVTGGTISPMEVGVPPGMCLTATPGSSDPTTRVTIQTCSGGGGAGGVGQVWALSPTTGTLSLVGGGGDSTCMWLPTAPLVNLYAKPLSPIPGKGQPMGLAVLNRGGGAIPGQVVDLTVLGFAPAQRVVIRDIWADTTSPTPVFGNFTTRGLASHETLLLVITPVPGTSITAA